MPSPRTVFFKRSKPTETGTIDDFHSDDVETIDVSEEKASEKTLGSIQTWMNMRTQMKQIKN